MTTQTPPAVLPETGMWTIDSAHSSARFRVTHHAVASFSAAFYGVKGSFDAATGKLEGSVEVESLHLPLLPKLKEHLLVEEWFDVERFPLISFDGVVSSGDQGLEADGDLTIRGATRPVTAEATVGGRAAVFDYRTKTVSDHIGIDLTTVIDRREFGLEFNNELPGGVRNLGWDVRLTVALELIEASE
ncbi:MAG: YceI family protein [Solirubrobacterales bacterium]